MVRAAQFSGMAAQVLLTWVEEKEILHALETGAAGIVLPFVESTENVRRAATALRFAPEGTRGTCTQTRANGYGSRRSGFVEYAREVNRELLLVGQIESRKGLEEIEEIIGVENGLDVAFWSSSDLGKPGQVNAPAVQTASQRIIDAARAAGKVPGLAQYEAAERAEWRARGCSFFALTSESGFLTRQLQAFRREVDAVSGQVR